jgi:hypothetical protein
MESKRRLVQRLAAEAEAAFARKKGAGWDEDEGLEPLEPDKTNNNNKLLETPGLALIFAWELARTSSMVYYGLDGS